MQQKLCEQLMTGSWQDILAQLLYNITSTGANLLTRELKSWNFAIVDHTVACARSYRLGIMCWHDSLTVGLTAVVLCAHACRVPVMLLFCMLSNASFWKLEEAAQLFGREPVSRVLSRRISRMDGK